MQFHYGLGRALFAYARGFFVLMLCLCSQAPAPAYIWVIVPAFLSCIGAKRR